MPDVVLKIRDALASEDPGEVISKLPDIGAYPLDNETLEFVLETARTEVDGLLSNLGSGSPRQAKAVSNA